MICRLEFCQKPTQLAFVLLGKKLFPPSNHPKNSNCFSFVDTKFESFIIDILGNHLLVKMNWSDHVQKTSNAPAPKPDVSCFQTKLDDKLALYGKEPSPKLVPTKFQQSILYIRYSYYQLYTITSSTVTSHNFQKSKYAIQGNFQNNKAISDLKMATKILQRVPPLLNLCTNPLIEDNNR